MNILDFAQVLSLTELPLTGGIGTKVFYIVGGGLVFVALLVLFLGRIKK